MDVRGVFTNTVPIDAYRGAGKPEANYLIERLIDIAARRNGWDPVGLRRRNMIAEFPYRSALGMTIDCGRFAANLDGARAHARDTSFMARRAEAAKRGRLRGLGVGCFLETARGTPNEAAEIRFDPDGRVSLILGTQSNGQGHETSYPQIAAALLGLPIDVFRLVQADTRLVQRGAGHGGARSMHQGGTALAKAAQMVIEKGRKVAAGLLQADSAEIVFVGGRFTVPGTEREIDLLAVARAATDLANLPEGMAPGLDSSVYNLLDVFTFPNGCHIAEVEIDPDTGLVTLERYTAVDDYGRLINPLLVTGQVQGGVTQGIGQALFEHLPGCGVRALVIGQHAQLVEHFAHLLAGGGEGREFPPQGQAGLIRRACGRIVALLPLDATDEQQGVVGLLSVVALEPEVERLLSGEGAASQATSLDLANVTFVDREAMVFLCSAKARNIAIENCPSYVIRWIQQERLCGAAGDDSTNK